MPRMLLIGSIVVAAGAFTTLALVAAQQGPPSPPPAPTVAPVEVAARLGLTPEVMAAAGVDGTQAATLLATLADSGTLVAAIENADLSASSAGAALTAAQEAARGPFATSESPAALAAAEAAFQSALAARESARLALFNAVTAGLDSGTKTRLAAAAAALIHSVPTAFTVVERTPEAWLDIQTALVAEARAARMGSTLADEHASLLAAVRAEEAVAAAHSDLANGLAGVQAAYASATAPGGN